ncbi:hypothetical protein [Nocardiopsis ganjiahuensis]|uniref:hypothetical protein n=1 Tax=Nocardiopsis ganjiahuensis TaxID=239984 RepID=UPI00034C6CF5|nr:hypothetical protein [Nocardiopsis ganjiahuensis]
MARTVHHTRTGRLGFELFRAVTATELRYGAAELRAARREGRRPVPRPVTRRSRTHEPARLLADDGWVSEWAAVEERRERQNLRRAVTEVRVRVNTAEGRLDPEAAEEVPLPQGRHRRSALWLV